MHQTCRVCLYTSYRESMQVMIASLEFAAKGRGVLKFFCHLEAASISFGTSAMIDLQQVDCAL